jgi:hypothetical protein
VPDETINDVVRLTVPANIPPGDYTVEVGMYRAEDPARCLTLTQDRVPVDRVVLGTERIEPQTGLLPFSLVFALYFLHRRQAGHQPLEAGPRKGHRHLLVVADGLALDDHPFAKDLVLDLIAGLEP